MPHLDRAGDSGSLRRELGAFTAGRLWLALSTSTLVIGATFAAFSYFNPILTALSGFSTDSVPLLLAGYGAATLLGNHVVGRLADRRPAGVLAVGLALNAAFLAAFALLAHVQVWAVAAMLGIGLVGVTMNPAMITRVQRTGNPGSLINTVHASFITLGVILGSSVGGLAVESTGLRGTLWLSAALARGRTRDRAPRPGPPPPPIGPRRAGGAPAPAPHGVSGYPLTHPAAPGASA
ncbi:MFS transporter [Streptomonospora salina]|uniref:Putative MFS family arabinose efflux permease n=1 Tax=Streptomonospora salina TaxID=104205 RepID=A0A841EER0_9ACTN|nr:MFS transporter [Streptomonospora salina]MBB5998910.1 putative MFS family arabinose efflux permease [Streptomonospora salina]